MFIYYFLTWSEWNFLKLDFFYNIGMVLYDKVIRTDWWIRLDEHMISVSTKPKMYPTNRLHENARKIRGKKP